MGLQFFIGQDSFGASDRNPTQNTVGQGWWEFIGTCTDTLEITLPGMAMYQCPHQL